MAASQYYEEKTSSPHRYNCTFCNNNTFKYNVYKFCCTLQFEHYILPHLVSTGAREELHTQSELRFCCCVYKSSKVGCIDKGSPIIIMIYTVFQSYHLKVKEHHISCY